VRTRDRQQIFRLDLPADLSVVVADGVSLQRILGELLNNACKYTRSRHEILMQVRLIQEKPRQLRFTIANQAEIPPHALPKIFDKFYRVKISDATRSSGTGLGLAVVKKLVQQLEGTIEVVSEAGWTTFTVELPHDRL
jgi:signal transduction histidine kinase